MPTHRHIAARTLIPATALLLVTLVGATSGSSRSDDPGPPPGTIISGRTKIKFKPKPVRKALELRYAAISEAYRRKEPEEVLRMRTRDFHAILPSGKVWDAAASAQYTQEAFAQVESTLALTFDIGRIELEGDTAAAEIDQHWVRRQHKGGALRFVDTRAHQRETWVRHGSDWMLWRVDQVNPGPWIVDGKAIDPSKPYDPGATAYPPH